MKIAVRVGIAVAIIAVLALIGTGIAVYRTWPPMPPQADLYDAVRDYTGQLPVFPGAEGFGVDTPAGRGGKVMHVATLAADGPGSLREALGTAGPRIVVFDVAGVIDYVESPVISEPYVTVAGQTAPEPGITLIGAGMVIVTHDALVQHLRFRIGDRPEGPDPSGRDGFSIYGDPGAGITSSNVVVDHCSIAWALDENASTWNRTVMDITFRQCIFAEGLSHSLHAENEHSKGLLVGDHARRVAVIGCLFAHNMQRNPFIKGDVSALIANNLVYDPGQWAIHFGDNENSGPSLGTVAGNMVLPGPSTPFYVAGLSVQWDAKNATRVYVMDLEAKGIEDMRSWRAWRALVPISSYADALVRVEPLTLRNNADARDWVLEHAGARPKQRDATDTRIVADVRQGTGSIIDSQNQVEGLPYIAEVRRVAEVPPNPNGDDDHDGYTNIEAWLHAKAAEIE